MIWLILFLGFCLRLINLNQSLWLDEAITALAVKNNTLTQIITTFSPGDFHPPLYYLILKLWTNVFGYSEIALRIPSVIFGVLTIFVVYKIGEKLSNKRTGLFAAILMAVNPLGVYYSQEARMYSLAMMLVAGSIYFLQEKKWFWFVIFATASLYTDYLPGLMLPVYFLLTKNRKILLAPVVLFFPWIPSFLAQISGGIGVSSSSWGDLLGRPNLKNLLLVPVKFVFGRISVPDTLVYIVGAVYAFILLKSRELKYWLWLIVPLFLAALISIKIPIFTYFRFLFVLPAFCLLSAGSKKATIFVVLVSILSLAYFDLNPRFWREDWRGAALYVKQDPGKIVMPNMAQSAPLEYYNVDLNANGKTAYLFRYVQEIFDPQDLQKQQMEAEGYVKTEEKSFNNLLIWKYSL